MEKSKLKINKERVRHIKMSNAINDRIKDTINDTLDEMKVSELLIFS